MSGGPFSLAADMFEAGAYAAAQACEDAGLDPMIGVAGVLATLKGRDTE